jgi:hypothetical protein
MNEMWADITDDGEPMIDWDEAVQKALLFDGGDREYDAALGKILVQVQREAFEIGFREGVASKGPIMQMTALTFTGGTA